MQLQLQLNLTNEQQEYPDPYRGYRLIAQRITAQHSDRLGSYSAPTWQAIAYGDNANIDGAVIACGHSSAAEAIAAAMQYLDIFVGKVQSKYRYAEYFDEALDRVNARLGL